MNLHHQAVIFFLSKFAEENKQNPPQKIQSRRRLLINPLSLLTFLLQRTSKAATVPFHREYASSSSGWLIEGSAEAGRRTRPRRRRKEKRMSDQHMLTRALQYVFVLAEEKKDDSTHLIEEVA